MNDEIKVRMVANIVSELYAPTPAQIAESQQKAEDYLREKYGAYRGHFAWRELEEAFTTGYLRARTEQATEIAELKAKLENQRKLFSRCLEVLSTLEGECSTESEMLDTLKSDVKAVMGIVPLIADSLI